MRTKRTLLQKWQSSPEYRKLFKKREILRAQIAQLEELKEQEQTLTMLMNPLL